MDRKVPQELEVPLSGGDLTEGLVRVGETVRRPRIAESDLVEALLLYLQRCGFDGAPRFMGIDDAGRQVLSFVHGEVAGRPWPDWVADDQRILSVARLVRRYDDAAQGFGLPPVPAAAVDPGPAGMPASALGPATFVGHMDICPENVVFRNGQAWALIDFDLARPTNRLREVCNMLLWWSPLMPAPDREGSVRDLDVFARAALMVSAYGLGQADRALIAPRLSIAPNGRGMPCGIGPVSGVVLGSGSGTKAWANASSDAGSGLNITSPNCIRPSPAEDDRADHVAVTVACWIIRSPVGVPRENADAALGGTLTHQHIGLRPTPFCAKIEVSPTRRRNTCQPPPRWSLRPSRRCRI